MNVEMILCEAVEIPSDDERAAYLDRVCGSDTPMRARLEELVANHFAAGGFLEKPAAELIGIDPTTEFPEVAGTQIGPYKLLEVIGEGGMGVVYMAEQMTPIKRRVALKIIKRGIIDKQVISRFDAERQALSLMDHPNIAKVLDAGAAPSGRPYFVMELIKGVPVTQYCDDQKLTVDQRLELFVPICRAVQHAHQKGIIHRDIKPNNVLIADYDDQPVPKVIDFGIAKALHCELTQETLFTHYGQLVGTLDYMSPEQAKLNQLDIDTRSDIYSLGVLLYEMLVGETPLDRTRLRSAVFDEVLRVIREEEPPKPSTRLSNSSTLPSIAIRRGSEPHKLRTRIRGELDWIVMKALDKDRNRRYESADNLATDIQRFLEGDVVTACPPSVFYRVRKYGRRNRALLLTFSAIVVVLLTATVVSGSLGIWAMRSHGLAIQRLAEIQSERDQKERARRSEAKLRQIADEKVEELSRRVYEHQVGRAAAAYAEDDLTAMRDILGECTPRYRDWEWSRLDWLSRPKSLLRIPGHSVPRFSPNGEQLLALGSDLESDHIKIWDVATHDLVHTLRVSDRGLTSVFAMHPNGRKIVTGTHQGTLTLWDLNADHASWAISAHSTRIQDVTFRADGRRLASASEDGTLMVWDTDTGECSVDFGGVGHSLRTVAFSPSGKQILTAANHFPAPVGPAIIWNAHTRRKTHVLRGHNGGVSCASYSPDGRFIVTGGDDQTVRLWDSSTGEPLRTFFGHTDGIRSVTFSSDARRIASGSVDQTVRIWDSESGRLLTVFPGHGSQVWRLAFSPGDELLASSAWGEIHVWDPEVQADAFTLRGDFQGVTTVAYSSDGRQIAAVGFDRSVKVWDVENGLLQRTMYGHTAKIHAIAWRPGQKQMATGDVHGVVFIWDVDSGRQLQKVVPHEAASAVNQIAYCPDGARLVTTGQDGTLCLLDGDSGECLRILRAHQAAAVDVAYSHDGKWIASSSEDGTVVLWSAASGKPVRTLRGHKGTVWPVAFSPDDRLVASGGADGTIQVWNRDTGVLVHKLGSNSKEHGGGSTVSRLLFSNSGRRLISSDWLGFLRVWSVEDGRELMTWRHGHRWVSGLALSPDGKTLASAGYGNVIRLWESGPPPTPGVSRRSVKAARRLVDERFRQVTFLSDVVSSIQDDGTFTEAERDVAIRIATARGDNPFFLNQASWDDVRLADRGKSIYRQALAKAERACRIVPDCAEYQVTLGLASYRAGNYEAALGAFRRARDLRQSRKMDAQLYELTGIAMSHYRLGDLDSATAMLSRVREVAETELWRRAEPAQALLRKAQQLIESRNDESSSLELR